MKTFIAIIAMIAIGYGIFYFLEHKDQIIGSREVRTTFAGVEYIAPNNLDNPGYIYAKRADGIVWKIDLTTLPEDSNLPLEAGLREYRVTNMHVEPRFGKDALIIQMGKDATTRMYTLDINDGKKLRF